MNDTKTTASPAATTGTPKGKSRKLLYAFAAGVIVGLCAWGIWTFVLNDKVRTFTVNGVTFDMIKVNAGTFTMGYTGEKNVDEYFDEMPHEVTLTNDYYMGKTEVTQALWTAVMGSNPSTFKGDNLPADGLSWNDCQEFVKKLNSLTGENFRLPTEAEWEFAARGGNKSQHYLYCGSNNIDEVAWTWDNSGNTSHEVATKLPNELGLYDMNGNLSEWCQDWYGDFGSVALQNPAGPADGYNRAIRGGDWDCVDENFIVWSRMNSPQDYRCNEHGLRLCLTK